MKDVLISLIDLSVQHAASTQLLADHLAALTIVVKNFDPKIEAEFQRELVLKQRASVANVQQVVTMLSGLRELVAQMSN